MNCAGKGDNEATRRSIAPGNARRTQKQHYLPSWKRGKGAWPVGEMRERAGIRENGTDRQQDPEMTGAVTDSRGTTAKYSLKTFENKYMTYAAEGITEPKDVEWWAKREEKSWNTGDADGEDWANPGKQKN